ncbi:MAG: hypothetical protein JNK76_09595 [Planctomycetales bacterium]|nr:hypothetical protein [Planctomycetales bacterium]MBN8626983.1 hypothetical protein [Planctomycetota bacterium]
MNVRFASLRRTLAVALPILALAGTPLFAADEKAESKPAVETKVPAKKAAADRKGPLPFYYGKVVAPDQKETIYGIQEKYAGEIAPLAAKIKELMAARDKEIEAVLSPEQLAKIKQLKADAAAKAAAGKKPAVKKPAEEPKAEKTAAGN